MQDSTEDDMGEGSETERFIKQSKGAMRSENNIKHQDEVFNDR